MAQNLSTTLQKGAMRTVQPQALALPAGFAGSRFFEKEVYEAFPEKFGVNDGVNVLTEEQERNRKLLKAGAILAAGIALVAPKSPARKNKTVGAAVAGFMAGESWHLANDFGVNV